MSNVFTKLFRKSTESRTHQPSLYYRGSLFQPTADSYTALATEGYKSNAYVRRCVMLIAFAASGIPLHARNGKGDLVPESELQKLLDRHAGSFISQAFSYLMLSGNNYIEIVNGSRYPVKLFNVRPDQIARQPDGTFHYGSGKQKTVFEPDEIIHTMLFDPLNPLSGSSPISAARRAIDSHNAANDWNAGTLRNSASPSGILTTDSILSDEDFERLSEEVLYGWTGENAKLPKVLDNSLKWQQMSLTAVDMSFIDGKKDSAQEIATAFGVPPELLGQGNTTYSNRNSAMVSFYSETVKPLVEQFTYDLSNVLAPKFGDYYIEADYSSVPALKEQEDVKVQKTRVLSGVATVNELRAIWGLPAVEGGDIIVMGTEEANNEMD